MGDEVSDLFGNPVRQGKGKRGRPTFEVTERNRNKVKLLLALGWSNERVSNAIDCSLATLKRYFRAELSEREMMRDRLEAERIMVMSESALNGVIGAARVFQQMLDRNDEMQAERSLVSRPAKHRPLMVLGKKQWFVRKLMMQRQS
ncbi:hypothetical protein [Roseobacter sp. TSBP12]|uniref:hypothetical protein n=1 Tax=Roseobacter sp. TSBP12 TaxID=1236613 RepID=UPI00186A3553|nr:hypothetical protein [Roseobacter sp. TSBP12]